jgi:hypothetical protein
MPAGTPASVPGRTPMPTELIEGQSHLQRHSLASFLPTERHLMSSAAEEWSSGPKPLDLRDFWQEYCQDMGRGSE